MSQSKRAKRSVENRRQVKPVVRSLSNTNSDVKAALVKIYLLLLLDQFSSGVWGASIESTLDLYGKKNDPGSISVSVSCALAITALSGSSIAQPITHFRRYLLSRRSANGAFGMRRFIGSAAFPAEHVFENPRHTAGALLFFLNYDGVRHECARGALSFLLNQQYRTPSGLWVDQGTSSDSRVDPLTVGNVVEALEASHRSMTSNKSEQIKAKLDNAIRIGIQFLFDTRFRTPEGFWIYRYESAQEYERVLENSYRYTAGILSNIVRSCVRLNLELAEVHKLVKKLVDVSQSYDGSLPTSPSSNIPSLSATVNLITTSMYFSDLRDQAEKSIGTVFGLCRQKRIIENAMAPGWAAIGLLSKHAKESDVDIRDHVDDLDLLAADTLSKNPDTVKIPEELRMHEPFVREILRLRRARSTL